ncbi:PREDICTED: lysophosphatidylcholine acyltransferase 1 [Ceratotherium simum simum]|uniref:Lysophosphatidylcholine acyltransferase 1 n=1 Tax=Ceratotherium simum simum TaxID=73337 RepID=A0ABM1DFD8_CERSS|nr:PREDICTED: lysophosphatidylcholine acyltransferase 1 [Ceratotherium simum simum]
MTLTLFPIRLLVAAFMMLLAWPFALVASLGSAEQEPEQPLALWRKVVDFLLRAIMRTMWFAGGFHRVVVKGRQALPTEAAILTVAPHSSYFDAIPVTMTMSSIVMKAESRDIPIWGTLIKYIKPVFVSRSDQDSRRKTVEEIKRRAQLNRKWPQIMIFPEGTCTNRTCLITFKPGAFIPGVPVQPVVLRYPNKLDTITWTWQGPGALEILWLTLCQFHNQVEIEFLPVYSPSAEEKKDPALYATNVRRVMAEALGVPVTDYTYEDCQLALAEGQLRLPADTCLLEFARLVRGLGLKPEKLEKDLDKYAESAKMKRGEKIGLTEFAAFLEVPISDTLEDMFSLFDESGAGEMDLREYVVALSVVCRPSQTLDTIQLAFKMYGSPEDGSVDEDTLSSILKTALGVAELAVTDLFRAIDQEEKEKITFADFNRLAEMHPDFAEEYLYPDQTCSESRAQPPPAPTPNGFCVDFSPENSDVGKKPVRKKLD